MKIEFDREQLNRALQKVGTVVERKSTMAALGNLLLEAKDKILTITATDLETTIQSTCPVKTVEEGRICIPARNFTEIVKELPEKTGKFSKTENEWMRLESGKAQFRVVGMSPEKFPKILETGQFAFQKIRMDTFRRAVEKTSFAISTDEMRYNLNGAFLETAKGDKGQRMFRMVATDGHRLALVEYDLSDDETFSLKKGIILPRKGIMELKRLLTGSEEQNLELAVGEAHAAFRVDGSIIFMRLVVGEFPDYNAVIPKANKKRLMLSRNAFSDSIRRVSLLSEGRSKCIHLDIKGNGVRLAANSPELGEAEEDVHGEFDGGEMEIGFNARYLLDALGVVETDRIVIELGHETSPGVVREPDDPSYFGVIMPMRV